MIPLKYKYLILCALIMVVFSSCGDPLSPDYDNIHDPKSRIFEPDKPRIIGITIDADDKRVISWRDFSDHEAGFKIVRRPESSSQIEVVGSTDPDVTSFEDTSRVLVNTAYFYKVIAFSEFGVLVPSDSIRYGITFTPPSELFVQCLSPASVKIGWEDNTAIEKGYCLESSINKGPFQEITRVQKNVNSYVFAGINNSESYSFRVCAFTNINKSEYTKTISISYVNQPVSLYSKKNEDNTKSLAISPDGSLLVAGGREYSEYRLSDGAALVNIPTYSSFLINSIRFSPDGNSTAYGIRGYICLRNIGSYNSTLLAEDFTNLKEYTGIRFSQTGDTLVALNVQSKIQLWNMKQKQILKSFQGVDSGFIDLSPDGKFVTNGNVIIRLSDGQVVHTFPKAANMIFNPDGKSIGFVNSENHYQLWDINSETMILDLSNQIYNPFISFDKNGERAALVSQNGVDIVDTRSGSIITSLNFNNAYYTEFNPVNNTLVVASRSGNVSVFAIGPYWKTNNN